MQRGTRKTFQSVSMGKNEELIDKKIIILGDASTGKTTLLKNIKNGSNYITEQLMSNKYELRAKNRKSKSVSTLTYQFIRN